MFQGSITVNEELALVLTYNCTGATTNIHSYLSVVVKYVTDVQANSNLGPVKGHFVNCFSGFNIQYSDIFC